MTCRSKIAKIVLIGNPRGHHDCHLENLFFISSPEPKGQLIWNLVGSIGMSCRAKEAKIVLIGNPRWPTWPPSWKSICCFFSWNERPINCLETWKEASGWLVDQNSLGMVGCGESVMYLTSLRRPTDIGLLLGKACYPCSGCAVRLETRRSRVQPPPRSATFFRGDWSWNTFYSHSLPSADSRRAVVSFWRKNVHNTG